MSKYSGKCDFGDTWEILGDRVKNMKVYFGNNIVPLEIHSYKDALPYFPYLVSMMESSDEGTIVRLCTVPYTEEIVTDEYRNYVKELLFNDMITAGWEESRAYRWVYGWEPWCEKYLQKKLDEVG